MSIHILGIRHHGPGSAANVKAQLEALRPDIVLVEGPPEADAILSSVGRPELTPPVAILVYQPDNLKRSAFYPFAGFSPEWQAILYAREHHIPVRFMDLPVSNQLALEDAQREAQIRLDPIAALAKADGYDDGEQWWEQTFERRQDSEQVFEAVMEAMGVLRETLETAPGREALREAHMRKTIRQAEKEMYACIAVICGAWHAPALQKMPSQKYDNDLLKGLPKIKTETTWIPWTYQRLGYFSGYGAGIQSPGWYEHVWNHPKDDGTRWMAKVAQLFRQKQMDTSVAHVMEAVRLASALAGLRMLPRPGLPELNEATLSVICNGEDILMRLIWEALIVSNKMGQVPDDIPKPPLQVDIEKQQKKLRLPASPDWKDYVLDLRKEGDLERSIFLHRLQLLGIRWGQKNETSGKGTFKEAWRLQWEPELSLDIIEKGSWGNTTEEAASAYLIHQAEASVSLKDVCGLLENALPAELPPAVEVLIRQVNNLSAAAGDVIQMMEVVPGLVSVSRYGNVRKTDSELVTGIVRNMIVRICVSLPGACTSLDEDAAAQLLELFLKLNDAISLLQETEITEEWRQTLAAVASSAQSAPLIGGYATRILADRKWLVGEDLVKAFSLAMSISADPAISAAWLEGFLKGSGTLLLLDADLWNVINNWIAQIPEELFMQLLPLLRRTFAHFSKAERRKLGERVKAGKAPSASKVPAAGALDMERGMLGIPVVLQLLGYK